MNLLSQKSIIIVAVIGFIISISLTWKLYLFETFSINNEFKIHVDEEIQFIDREIVLNFDAIYALQAFFNAEKSVSQKKFESFSKDILLHHPNIQALEWIPTIPLAARTKFESAVSHHNPGFVIIEKSASDGSFIQAKQRNIYFPVTFIEPLIGNQQALGYDLGSDPLIKAALTQAIDTGELVITDTIDLVHNDKNSDGFLAIVPIYQANPTTELLRKQQLVGLVSGVFRVAQLIDSAIHHSSVKDIHIELKEQLSDSKKLIFKTPFSEQQIHTDLAYQKQLGLIGTKQWELVAYPTENYMTSRRTMQPFVFGFLSLMVTFALCFYLSILLRRSNEIEQAVIERTKELKEARDQLEKQSLIDGLTGIANRRHIDLFLEHAWAQAIRSKKPISALMIDIDYFKQYNDNYGHQQGDIALKQVANTLKMTVSRKTELVGRYGGEEFVVILPDVEDASVIGEMCRKKVEQLQLFHQFSKIGNAITVSIGYAVLYPSPHDQVEQLLKQADEALYAAKAAGRNRVESFQYPQSTILSVSK